MFCSEPRIPSAAFLLAAAVVVGACDDPTAERSAPRDRHVLLMAALDPAFDRQPFWLATFDFEQPEDVVAELLAEDTVVATAVPTAAYDCRERLAAVLYTQSGSGGGWCMAFEYQVRAGTTYELVVHSRDRPTATARTTVPGDFHVVGGLVEGDPPGTERFDVTWTGSDPSHSYVAFVMDRSYGIHGPYSGPTGLPSLSSGWMLFTTDTAISTFRPRDEVWDGKDGDWVVAVYAMDRALYDFATSGSVEALFPIPPASNVVNGYGLVGSWVRRYVPVDSLPPP